MIVLVKFYELSPAAIITITLKVLTIVCLLGTLFSPILEIQYTGSGITISITYFSLTTLFAVKEGITPSTPTIIRSDILNSLFILVLVFIIVNILLLIVKKNLYSGIANALAFVSLMVLCANYYLVTTLNGQLSAGVSITIIDDPGYYLLLLGLILLYVSAFTKFALKPTLASFSLQSGLE